MASIKFGPRATRTSPLYGSLKKVKLSERSYLLCVEPALQCNKHNHIRKNTAQELSVECKMCEIPFEVNIKDLEPHDTLKSLNLA